MEFTINIIHHAILFYACIPGNLDLVKYLISLNQFDIKMKSINFFIF